MLKQLREVEKHGIDIAGIQEIRCKRSDVYIYLYENRRTQQ